MSENNRTFNPEGSQKEYWELRGRVDAALSYIQAADSYYLDKKVMTAMLGGDVSALEQKSGDNA